MAGSSRKDLERELVAAADPERAKNLAWFFKTGKGEYAQGDRFLGLSVPSLRRIALRYRGLGLSDLQRLLASPLHEHRFAAIEILVAQFERADEDQRKELANFYLAQTSRINNWDLVDASAPYILGSYLLARPRAVLDRLAKSDNLWERRIAIVSTFAFIKVGSIDDTFRIAEILLGDRHDLIHKAVVGSARGRQSEPARAASLLAQALRTPAPDDATLCDREVPGR
jgi:hypothetical protein